MRRLCELARTDLVLLAFAAGAISSLALAVATHVWLCWPVIVITR